MEYNGVLDLHEILCQDGMKLYTVVGSSFVQNLNCKIFEKIIRVR